MVGGDLVRLLNEEAVSGVGVDGEAGIGWEHAPSRDRRHDPPWLAAGAGSSASPQPLGWL